MITDNFNKSVLLRFFIQNKPLKILTYEIKFSRNVIFNIFS
jgi:hypothetical protein